MHDTVTRSAGDIHYCKSSYGGRIKVTVFQATAAFLHSISKILYTSVCLSNIELLSTDGLILSQHRNNLSDTVL